MQAKPLQVHARERKAKCTRNLHNPQRIGAHAETTTSVVQTTSASSLSSLRKRATASASADAAQNVETWERTISGSFMDSVPQSFRLFTGWFQAVTIFSQSPEGGGLIDVFGCIRLLGVSFAVLPLDLIAVQSD